MLSRFYRTRQVVSVIDIKSAVKRCVVPLYAELVIVMDNERSEVAQNVCTFTIIGTNSLVNKLIRDFLPWTHLRYQSHAATGCPKQEVCNSQAQDSAKSGSIGIRDRLRWP